jgi:L-arabinokinase
VPSTPPGDGKNLGGISPVPILVKRLRDELAPDFAGVPVRLSRAPGRLDVMGGIADYTGSLVCEATLDCAAAVGLSRRSDRLVRISSLNLRDDGATFRFDISIDALAEHSVDQLRKQFNESGCRWAGYLAGCLKILHDHELVDLKQPRIGGLNLAVYGTVPLGAGVSSSASIEVATMMNLCGHFGLLATIQPLKLAAMCQEVENRLVGAPCGIMDQVSSCCGRSDSLLRLLCQPHELQPPLNFPAGVRAVGIDSRVKHSVGGPMYGRTRCAAFMGHKIILEKMREMGDAAGQALQRDPMNGYLANLSPDDYKRYFRPHLPEWLEGHAFLDQYHSTIDRATTVDPAVKYHVQRATDHHVLEANRVRNFVLFLEEAAAMSVDSGLRAPLLNKAGHLMYASHISYTRDALMGADECDLLVALARKRESAGIYGAKITGGGCGGTVAVLCDRGERADKAVVEIVAEYNQQTGKEARVFMESSPGAWQVGTLECRL